MKVNFEEKTYESYFNIELSNRSDTFFPPGQRLEGLLGFDSCVLTRDKQLWNLFMFMSNSANNRGIDLHKIAEEMENFESSWLKKIPKIKVNVLFQYKKPEYISSARGKEWHLWGEPYYRYEIYQKQQELLMRINQKLESKVLILYVSPALYDIRELLEAYKAKRIIDFSNFQKVSALYGHHCNTYIKAGNYSIANSQPKKIDNIALLKELEQIEDRNTGSNIEFIINFCTQISNIMSEDKYYSELFNKLNQRFDFLKNDCWLVYNYIMLYHFKLLTGIQCLMQCHKLEK